MNLKLSRIVTTVAVASMIIAPVAMAAKDKTACPTPNTVSNSESKLMVDISKGNMEELKLSELAQTQATNPQVKDFAKTMIEAHSQAANKLGEVASKNSVSLPSELASPAANALNKLKATTGPAFDKLYMSDMVAGHKKVLNLVKNLASKAKNADVKALATELQPTVSQHLTMATSLQSTVASTATKATTSKTANP
jgi:putative membrane protein